MFKVLVTIVATLLLSLGAVAETVQLNTDNTITFRGEVNETSVLKAQMELASLVAKRGKKDYTIYLVMDSPGGSISDGEDFIQFAKLVPNLKTISIFAASMGSAIVEALPGQRLVAENGILMFHRARGGVEGQFEDGELEVRLEFYKKMVRSMEKRNADRMGLVLKDYKAKVKDELWLWSQESVTSGAADKVVSMSCSQGLIQSKDVITVFMFIFEIDLEFSKCPLIRVGVAKAPEDKVTLKKMLAEAEKQSKDVKAIYFKGIAR